MKYSLTAFHPAAKTLSTDVSKSSAVLPLLMIRRILSVPASGARVKLVLRMRLISSISVRLSVSTRSEGRARATRPAACFRIRVCMSGSMQL